MLDVKKTLTKMLTKGDYRELLWTNTSTSTTGFAAQTVPLNLSGYDAVDVEFSNGTGALTGAIFRAAINGNGLCVMNSTAAASVRGRYFSVSSTGVSFNAATNGTSSSNVVAIPRRIWGVKLGGVVKKLLSAFIPERGCFSC